MFLAVSAFVLWHSTAAFALDDGWYKAKSATGPCSEPMMRSTIAVQQGAPASISFTGESLMFLAPVKPTKTSKNSTGQFDVTIAEPSKNSLTLKFLAGECAKAEVSYSLAP
jgi:hypothetical protein